MSTEGTEATDVTATTTTPTEDIESIKRERDALRAKAEELLHEKKKVSQRLADEQRAKDEAERERLQKSGDYKQLLKSAEEQSRTYKEKHDALLASMSEEKIKTESLKLASELADGHNAVLLAKFIRERLRFSEDGQLRVTDDAGNLTVSALADLKREFANSEVYRSLLRGNKSSGGGATGSKVSGTTSGDKVMTREEHAKLNQTQEGQFQLKAFFKGGGKLVE